MAGTGKNKNKNMSKSSNSSESAESVSSENTPTSVDDYVLGSASAFRTTGESLQAVHGAESFVDMPELGLPCAADSGDGSTVSSRASEPLSLQELVHIFRSMSPADQLVSALRFNLLFSVCLFDPLSPVHLCDRVSSIYAQLSKSRHLSLMF